MNERIIILNDKEEQLGFVQGSELLWFGGTNWYPAIFKTRKEARNLIKDTNNWRRHQGYKPIKMKTKSVKEASK